MMRLEELEAACKLINEQALKDIRKAEDEFIAKKEAINQEYRKQVEALWDEYHADKHRRQQIQIGGSGNSQSIG